MQLQLQYRYIHFIIVIIPTRKTFETVTADKFLIKHGFGKTLSAIPTKP